MGIGKIKGVINSLYRWDGVEEVKTRIGEGNISIYVEGSYCENRKE